MLRRLLVIAIVIAAQSWMWGSSPAIAGDHVCPGGTTPVVIHGGVICVKVEVPGHPGHHGHHGHHPEVFHHSGCFTRDGRRVRCHTSLGTWWFGYDCYATPSTAPPGSPQWQGHTDGSLWVCTACAVGSTTSNCHVQIIWLKPGSKGGPPDPGRLAKIVIRLLPLAVAEVHTAPQAPKHTYVGVENWLWVPRSQWATLTKTVRARATSVTVTARPKAVSWDMGPQVTSCSTPGRAWRSEMTDAARTGCGYVYSVTSDSEPNDVFAISATIRYDVSWVCDGWCSQKSADLGLVSAPAGAGSMRVMQRQTVVVR